MKKEHQIKIQGLSTYRPCRKHIHIQIFDELFRFVKSNIIIRVVSSKQMVFLIFNLIKNIFTSKFYFYIPTFISSKLSSLASNFNNNKKTRAMIKPNAHARFLARERGRDRVVRFFQVEYQRTPCSELVLALRCFAYSWM